MIRSVPRSAPSSGPGRPTPSCPSAPCVADEALPHRPRDRARLAAVAIAAAACLAAPASPARAQSGPVNSVDTILDDMRLMNDAPLAGVAGDGGWVLGPGHVVMGADPRGTATPWWWNPSNRALKSADWWTALIGWMVVFDGESNAATNTRVEMRGMRTYVRSSRTGRWAEVASGPIAGALYARSLSGASTGRLDVRVVSDEVRSIRPSRTGVFHGWIAENGMATIEPWDVAAVHVSLHARLATDDPSRSDDRDRAVYLLHVGADYYPNRWTGTSAFSPTGYNPGVGVSRAKRIGNDWQAFSFTTVNVGRVESNGRAMTEAELRADPPPLR